MNINLIKSYILSYDNNDCSNVWALARCSAIACNIMDSVRLETSLESSIAISLNLFDSLFQTIMLPKNALTRVELFPQQSKYELRITYNVDRNEIQIVRNITKFDKDDHSKLSFNSFWESIGLEGRISPIIKYFVRELHALPRTKDNWLAVTRWFFYRVADYFECISHFSCFVSDETYSSHVGLKTIQGRIINDTTDHTLHEEVSLMFR